MSLEDLQNLLFNPGRFVINPTNLALAFPHGGTALGYIRDIAILPNQITVVVRAEEWGNVAVETVDGGRSYVIGANLRGWDDDAVASFNPGATVGAASGRTSILEITTSPRAGSLGSALSVNLLFVPDDLVNHHMVQIPRAIPLIAETAEYQMQLANEHLMAVMFLSVPGTSNTLYKAFFKEDGGLL